MNLAQMREFIVKDREERIGALRKMLLETFHKKYESGSQLPIPVKTKEGDEPAIERMLRELEEEGIKMTYHFDNTLGGREHILIHARQPRSRKK